MDANWIAAQLATYQKTVDGHLQLSIPESNNLGSTDIANLIQTYFSGQLTFAINGQPAIGNGVVYTGSMEYLGAATTLVANFHPLGNTVQVTLTFTLPGAWTFSQSFSALKGSAFDAIQIANQSFVLNSTAEAYPAGLNFVGVAQVAGRLKPMSVFLNNVSEVSLAGPIQLTSDTTKAPTISLQALAVGTATLGPLMLEIDFLLSSQYLANGALVASARLGAAASWSGSAVDPFPIYLELSSDDPTTLTFDLGGKTYPIPGWSSLTGLSSGQSFNAIVPSTVPLPTSLSLGQLSVTVNTRLKRLTSVTVGIVMDDWPLLPNDILTLKELSVAFTVAFGTKTANSSGPQLSAVLDGIFQIGTAFAVELDITIPGLLITGELTPGSTIQVTALFEQFVTKMTGQTFELPAGAPNLVVDQLSLAADVKDKSFTISSDITTDWQFTLFGDVVLGFTDLSVVVNYSGGTVTGSIAGVFLLDTMELTLSATKVQNGWILALESAPGDLNQVNPPAPGSYVDLVHLFSSFFSPGYQFPSIVPSALYIMGVGVSVDTSGAENVYTLKGAIVGQWGPALGTVTLQIAAFVDLQRQLVSGNPQWSGTIGGEVDLNNLKMQVSFDFNSTKDVLTVVVGPVTATLTIQTDSVTQQQETILSIALGNLSVGGIIEFLVDLAIPGGGYKLPAPWDVLDSISLYGLTLTINMTTQAIGITYPINKDLGIINLKVFTLSYVRNNGQPSLNVSLTGTFLGQEFGGDNSDPLQWDALNQPAPAVPGKGPTLFDLQYLGLGQRVTLDNIKELSTIDQIMQSMISNLLPTNDPMKLPAMGGLRFDADSNWLIGAQFVVMETVALSVIFNDPDVYGLRITLSGAKAKIFAGLAFEILYRKVTDTIGLYHIELKLPDAMRQLQFGEVSVTLPIVDLDIYTNGNFRIDLGFPVNMDFSRSFCVQVFPFVGYGGFYFALLDGATSDRVPKIDNGTFSPVIEFGIGLSLGVGKTIDEGVLSAGITVTVVGIVEGCIGWFHPDDKSLAPDTYYWIQGTVAIVGKLYGTIDFAIIKASVTVTAYASVTLVIEAYQPIYITLDVGVSVEVRVKIIFFTIHLSFKMQLKESITIGHASTPPWHVIAGGSTSAALTHAEAAEVVLRQQRPLHAPVTRFGGMRHYQSVLRLMANLQVQRGLDWAGAVTLVGPPQDIGLTLVPMFTQSLSTPLILPPHAPALTGAVVQYVLVPLIYNAVPSPNPTPSSQGNGPGFDPLAFNRLAQAVLRWAIAARVGSGTTVTAADLAYILQQLSDDTPQQTAFTHDNLIAFLTENIRLHLAPRAPTATMSDPAQGGTAFPMIPAVQLTTSAGESVYYLNDPRLQVSSTYITDLAAYFEQFMVSAENAEDQSPNGANQGPAPVVQDTGTETLPSLIFYDYFLMLARAVVQAAIDALKSFTYTISEVDEGWTLQQIANSFPTGEDPADNVTPLSIVTANQTVAGLLNTSQALTIKNVAYQIRQGDTLAIVATGRGFATTPSALAVTNAAIVGLLAPNVTIGLGTATYTVVDDGETADTIATLFQVTAQAVTAANPHGFPTTAGEKLTIPGASYVIQAGDTFQGISTTFALDIGTLGTLNGSVANLLVPLVAVAIPPCAYTPTSTDTFKSLAQAFNLSLDDLAENSLAPQINLFAQSATISIPKLPALDVATLVSDVGSGTALNNVAGIVSRFLLHGLRLPTPTTSTPDMTKMVPMSIGTGQQLLAPAPPTGGAMDSYSFTLTNPGSVPWLNFVPPGGGTPTPNLTYSFTAADFTNITNFTNLPLAPTYVSNMARLAAMQYLPNRYTAQQITHWLCADGPGVVVPAGAPPNNAGEPSIWMFPTSLLGALASAPAGTQVETLALPFELLQGTYIDAVSPMKVSPISGYAWATTIALNLRELPRTPQIGDPESVTASSDSMPNTYLITGTDDAGRQRLQDLWTYLHAVGGNDVANLFLLYPPNPAQANSKGLASDVLDQSKTFILKTNLSTTSNQRAAIAARLAAAPEPSAPPPEQFYATLQDAPDFVKLLWECATVNSGGFSLTYTPTSASSGGEPGLPGYLFAQNGEATVTLMVILNSQKTYNPPAQGADPSDTAASPMYAFNTCAAIGDNVDGTSVNLFVQPRTHVVTSADTLTSIAATHQIPDAPALDATALALFNQDVRVMLVPGFTIKVDNQTHVVKVGDSLATVAAAIDGNNIQQIIRAIATAYASTSGFLLPGAVVQFGAGQMTPHATVPAGAVGFEMVLQNPDPNDVPLSQLSSQAQLGLLFNLLEYEVGSTTFFAPANGAGTGLPAGPSTGSADQSSGLQDAVNDPGTTVNWTYRQVLAVSPFAVAQYNQAPQIDGLPAPASNPYAGVAEGSTVALSFAFQDVFGNQTAVTTPPNDLPLPVLYSDDLIPLSQWPGLVAAYGVDAGPEIQLVLSYDMTKDLPRSGADFATNLQGVLAHRLRYQQIYYQDLQADVQFQLRSSLLPAGTATVTLPKAAFLSLIERAYLFLSQVRDLQVLTHTAAPSETLTGIAATYLTDPGTLAAGNGALAAASVFDLTGVPTLQKSTYYLVNHGDTLTTVLGQVKAVDPTVGAFVTSYAQVALTAGLVLATPARIMPALTAATSIEDAATTFACSIVGLAEVNHNNPNRAPMFGSNVLVTVDGVTIVAGPSDTFDSLVSRFGEQNLTVTVGQIALANSTVPGLLASGAILTVDEYVTGVGDSLTTAAAAGGTDPTTLATTNESVPNLYPAGTPFLTGETTYTPSSGQTLRDVADAMGISLQDLGTFNGTHALASNPPPTLSIPQLVVVPTGILAPYLTVPDDSFAGIAARYGISATTLLMQNQNTWDVIAGGQSVTISGKTVPTVVGDTFNGLIAKFAAAGVTVQLADLATAMGSNSAYVATGMTLITPSPTSGSSPQSLGDAARAYAVDPGRLAQANAATVGVLNGDGSVQISYTPPNGGQGATVTVRPNETFNTLVAALEAIFSQRNQQVSIAVYDLAIQNASVANMIVPNQPLVAPVEGTTLTVSLGATPGFAQAMFPVTVAVDVARTDPKLIASDFSDATAVSRASSQVRPNTEIPYVDPTRPGAQGAEGAASSLRGFAQKFETAFGGLLKIGIGQKETAPDSDSLPVPVWAVQFGTSNGFAYSPTTTPQFFAIPPLASKLTARSGVSLENYTSGSGLSGDVIRDFQAIDMDGWALQFLQALDLFLTPEYAVAAYQIDPANFDTIVAQKQLIAEAIADTATYVLQVPTTVGDLTEAQDALEERLLITLADAYAIDTIVQYPISVTSSPSSDPDTAPRLAGNPVNRGYVTGTADFIETIASAPSIAVSGPFLAETLSDMRGVLNAGATVVYRGGATYTILAGDTLTDVANGLSGNDPGSVTVDDLVGNLTCRDTSQGLFKPLTPINLVGIQAVIGNNGSQEQPLATFEQLASYFDISVAAFAFANQGVQGLIAADFTYEGTQISVTPQDTLVTLAAKAGTTVAVLATTIEAVTGLLKVGLPVHSVDSLPEYSLSTSKFPLSLNGAGPTSFLTFFVNLRSDSAVRRAFFDLDFRINQLEYNITAVNGISDYQASSWLSFVLPLRGSHNPSAPTGLGQVAVPIPLRSYPTPPLLVTQGGDGTADPSHLEDTPFWNYQYTFQYQEAAQDTIGTTLTFNSDLPAIGRTGRVLRDTPADLFDGLAQFIFVADALMADLAGLPAWTVGASQTILGPAISAFSTIVQGIAATWGSWVEVKSQLNATSGPGQTYTYQLFNSRRSIGNGQEVLDELTVRTDGTAGAPLPNAAWVLVNGTMTPMSQVGVDDRDEVEASDTEVTFKYPGQLPAESSIQQQLRFGPLDVLSYEDAWAGIYITRNEGLLDWPPTNPDLVYTTPLVRFTNLFQPLISRDESFDIAPTDPPQGLAAILAAGLQSAFGAIFAAGASPHYVKLVAGYSYDLSPSLSTLTNGLSPVAPILMLPQLLYDPAVQQPNGGAPGPLATNVANAVYTWQQLNLTAGRIGKLVIDFTIFANVAPASGGSGGPSVVPGNPVLDLKRLYLPFAAELVPELVIQA